MAVYAEKTVVSVEKSRAEIERLLQKHGCDDFGYRNSRTKAQVAFKMSDRTVRFDLDLPDPERFRVSKGQRRVVRRTDAQVTKLWEQACRQRWRALALVIKAKLEAVEAGISTVEIEFLGHTVVPGGQVFHEVALPQIHHALQSGRFPTTPLLPG